MAHPNQNPNVFDAPGNDRPFFPKPPKNWVAVLKMYLRDFAPENILLNQEDESTDNQYELAFGLALLDWNESSPRLRPVGFENHPYRNGLLYKAAIEVLRSVTLKLMRNELDYSDGGERYNINSQYRSMMGWIERLDQEYQQGKLRIKTELNSSAAWGGNLSEFGIFFPSLNTSESGLE